MKNKKVYYISSLLLILFLGFFSIKKGYKEPKIVISNSELSENKKSKESGFVVYYFHNNARCTTCHRIENFTKEAFEQDFKNIYTFKSINIDEPKNRHFINDYAIYTKSVVLVEFDKKGKQIKFNNLSKVWNTIRNETTFRDYIRTEMVNFLDKNI